MDRAVPVAFLGTALFHRLMLGVVIPCAVIAFVLGCRQHRDAATAALGAGGLIALLVAALAAHALLGHTGERLLTLVGSGLLMSAHGRNYRLCRRARHVCEMPAQRCW